MNNLSKQSNNQDNFNLHLMLESILSENNNEDLSQNDIFKLIMEKNEKAKSSVSVNPSSINLNSNLNVNLNGINSNSFNGNNNGNVNVNGNGIFGGSKSVRGMNVDDESVKMPGEINFPSNNYFHISENFNNDINMISGISGTNTNIKQKNGVDKEKEKKEKDKKDDKKDDKRNSKKK